MSRLRTKKSFTHWQDSDGALVEMHVEDTSVVWLIDDCSKGTLVKLCNNYPCKVSEAGAQVNMISSTVCSP